MIYNLGTGDFAVQFEFTIPECDKVGIFFSGGIDSTSLLCLVIEELKATNRQHIPINVYTVNKEPDPDNAERLIPIIEQEYDISLNHIKRIPVSEEAVANRVIDMSSVLDAYNSETNMYLMMAGNDSAEKGEYAHLVPEDYPTLPWSYPNESYFSLPFRGLLKAHLMTILTQLNKEHLLRYTYSCSKSLPPNPCGVCYSCQEKIFAMDMLNMPQFDYVPLEVS